MKTFFAMGLALCLAVTGCRSATDESAPMCRADLPEPTVSSDQPIWSLRRLGREELARTYEVLFGRAPESLMQLPEEDPDASAEAPAPSSFEIDLYRQIAIEAASHGAPKLLAKWGCGRDEQCLRESAARFIERAYRGPLAPDEREALTSIFAGGASPERALRELLEFVGQSPRFLYAIERGTLREPDEQIRELTAWELAARVSYFLWSEPPDGALRAAAATGELIEPAVLQAHARRLVEDPKAARMVGRMLRRWAAPELPTLTKAHAVYPEFDPELRASLTEQFERFAAMVLESSYHLEDLLTTTRAPVDSKIASLLGMSDTSDWTIAELEPPRFGVLTLPGVLAAHARADDSSPVQRGLFIRQNLLCQRVPPPPPGVATLPPTSISGASFREVFEEHTRNPTCAGCHALMDPLGFPFEIYDGIGRTRHNLGAIRTDGQLDGIAAPRSYVDLSGLVEGLVEAPEVSRCWAQQWIQRALGPTAGHDTALLDEFAARVEDDVSLADLLVELVNSGEFRSVRARL